MSNYNMSISLGTGEDGKKRQDSYRATAQKESMSLSGWVKQHLDKVAHEKADTPEKSNPAKPSEV